MASKPDCSAGGASSSSTPLMKRQSFFFVVIPPEDEAISKDSSKAITSAEEFAAIVKRNPGARFHTGSSAEEAMSRALETITFSQGDDESIKIPSSSSSKPDDDVDVVGTSKRHGRSSLSAVEPILNNPVVQSPKTQDLLFFGREILTKMNEKVIERIERNPRILCTDAEFPTTLQEGCKYNALHLAAKCNNSEVMGHILNLVSSLDFMKRIHPNVSDEIRSSSTKHLLNCYLNTPDKMTQETPLHFACKFNGVECAQLLLSHPWTDTSAKNLEGLTPYQVIGSRDDPKGAKSEAIRRSFKQRYVLPIWRDEDVMGDPPVIGQVAFIPDLGQAIPPPLLAHFPDFSMSVLDPCKPELLPKQSSTMKVFMSQAPNWKVRAVAGPVEEQRAMELRKMLVRSKGLDCMTPTSSPIRRTFLQGTPPPPNESLLSPIKSRRGGTTTDVLSSSPYALCSPRNTDVSLRVRDAEKGLECVALDYCRELNIPWCEYWQFLGAYCDLRSKAGLDLLEQHFCSLETNRRKDLEEVFLNNISEAEAKVSDTEQHRRNDNDSLDDLINKLDNMDLDGSGMSSPGGVRGRGGCRNPKCKIESRWCTCDDKISASAAHVVNHGMGKLDDELRTTYGGGGGGGGDTTPEFVVGSSRQSPFFGIRKLDFGSPGITDSFVEASSSSSLQSSSSLVSSECMWPAPEGEQMVTEDCFETPPSSPTDDDVYEDCVATPVYLSGEEKPGKLDFQVFQILKDAEEEFDVETRHLAVFQWLNSMRAHGETIFGRSRRAANGLGGITPKRLWGEPSFVSTPSCKPSVNFDESF